MFSVVTDSESANFSSVRPSPSPRIFGGRKWRFWSVAWIATPAAHVTIRTDHTSKSTVQYRESPRSRRPTFDAVNALQLTVGTLTPTASSGRAVTSLLLFTAWSSRRFKPLISCRCWRGSCKHAPPPRALSLLLTTLSSRLPCYLRLSLPAA